MNAEEKAKIIAEKLSTAKGRKRLAENMREPLSYGFRVPYAEHEFLCDCNKVVQPTGFGLCPACGFDLMLSEPIPPLVIVLEAESRDQINEDGYISYYGLSDYVIVIESEF